MADPATGTTKVALNGAVTYSAGRCAIGTVDGRHNATARSRVEDVSLPGCTVADMQTALHHVELWTTDLAAAEEGWRWLLTTVGWSDGDSWTQGRTWTNPDGTYIVLEQSPDVMDGPHDRLRAGLNHLAINCSSVEVLDSLRAGSRAHGWRELFTDQYPNAGGPLHTALFLENAQGFEVEIVSP